MAMAIAGVLVACAGDRAGAGAAAVRQSPLTGLRLYVVPGSEAAQQAETWRKDGRVTDASTITRIAEQPAATWFTGSEPDLQREVQALTHRAALARRVPVLVAYNVPDRDCGGFSRGGADDLASYRGWIQRFAAGVGTRRAVIVVEPDALAQLVDGCLPPDRRATRAAAVRFAVAKLSALPRAAVYVDAGNAGWISPPRIAAPLRNAGIAQADGFAVNVSNFYGTQTSVRFGKALARRVGGKHFVVDTSRNGNGPWLEGGDQKWCNPPGRALGRRPTTQTGVHGVDAFLWVKTPGQSDGSCDRGEPSAGTWWPEYALGLAERAQY
jgi:endoglucanase